MLVRLRPPLAQASGTRTGLHLLRGSPVQRGGIAGAAVRYSLARFLSQNSAWATVPVFGLNASDPLHQTRTGITGQFLAKVHIRFPPIADGRHYRIRPVGFRSSIPTRTGSSWCTE